MHVTNFKWQHKTRHEEKAERIKNAAKALDECYRHVDARDERRSRRSGVLLTPLHGDPDKRLERHHMVRRGEDKKLVADPANVITLSATEHAEVKAGKAFYSGDANLMDAEGRLCGVKYERITDAGWQTVRMI